MASNAVSLNGSTLDRLSKRIAVPTYDRRALIPAIVHIGAGGFNRSHLCVYLDDLLSRPDTARLAECGVGLLPGDMRIHAGLQAQDHLYSLLVRDADEKSLR